MKQERASGDRGIGSAWAALTLVALVPAACVLWFMTAAMRNERLAVQQRLTDVYLTHLASLQRHLTDFWQNRQAALSSLGRSSPAEWFAAVVRSNLADSVVLYDRSGKVVYPSTLSLEMPTEEKGDWALASELEFQKNDFPAAAEAYGRVAQASQDKHTRARARQAQARCLLKAGRESEALARLAELAGDPSLRDALSAQGTLIVPSVQLRVLKLAAGADAGRADLSALRQQALDGLVTRLNLPDVRVTLLPPGDAFASSKPVPPQEAGDSLPGWRLGLSFKESDTFATLSTRQARYYLWTGFLVVLIILLVALAVARYLAAQMRLARLKDELVSAVSHELRTPLASIRALVDTLSAGRYRDEQQLQEYLQLIGKENLRLSHLIENFLTFSRLERGKQRFSFEDLAPESVVTAAVQAVKERLASAACCFTTDVAPDLPRVRGDADALATVLINLLDNACKYTGDEKRIRVRAFAEGRQVCFEVEDNGIGLNRREAQRIFDRFYQVDQSSTRQHGGCGLGLSIVQSIVHAHHGTVEVQSEPGKGSTFQVRLPVSPAAGGGVNG